MKCGLLGRKLGHSYSPQIHKQLADYPYTLYEREPEDLEEFLLHSDFTGINVTIPYKKSVIPYCDELSDRAKKLGAVNTIIRRSDGSLIGHNTDYFGFQSMLFMSGLFFSEKKALVLGSGGASATAIAVLTELGANAIVISRSGENNYINLHLHKDAAFIINATPVGMFPNTNLSPINLDIFDELEGVFDLIYNPAHTLLLQQAEERGLVARNGLWMLVAQAKESAEWFTGNKIDNDLIPRIHEQLQKQMQNIVLIGMPGSGKSTVGRMLAQQLGKRFVDADSEIERFTEMTIPEIFESSGEDGFRTVETKVLEHLGKESGLVIATGGGCVTRQENYSHLHRNGTIVWLYRDINKLPTDGRPLSQPGKLEQMYKTRKPLYTSFADCSFDNNRNIEETVAEIAAHFQAEV